MGHRSGVHSISMEQGSQWFFTSSGRRAATLSFLTPCLFFFVSLMRAVPLLHSLQLPLTLINLRPILSFVLSSVFLSVLFSPLHPHSPPPPKARKRAGGVGPSRGRPRARPLEHRVQLCALVQCPGTLAHGWGTAGALLGELRRLCAVQVFVPPPRAPLFSFCFPQSSLTPFRAVVVCSCSAREDGTCWRRRRQGNECRILSICAAASVGTPFHF